MTKEVTSKRLRAVDWGLRGLLAMAFIAAGTMKLAGATQFVAMFDLIGMGQWFRLLTGAVEVCGAVLLVVPLTSIWGALLLGCVMVGAIVTHLTVIGGSPMPALVLLAMTGTVLWLRHYKIFTATGITR